jgi:hypothetical protein
MSSKSSLPYFRFLKVGNIIQPLPQANTNYSRAKPTKMQARGSGQQNQQNENPNVRPTASTSTAATNEVKANLDSVLEISIDKRNVKSNNRGGKRKRNNLLGSTNEETANGDTEQ